MQSGDAIVSATGKVWGKFVLANAGVTAVTSSESILWSYDPLSGLRNAAMDSKAYGMTMDSPVLETPVPGDPCRAAATCRPHKSHGSCTEFILHAPGASKDASTGASHAGTCADELANARFTGAAGCAVPATAANRAAAVTEEELEPNACLRKPRHKPGSFTPFQKKMKEEEDANFDEAAHSCLSQKVSDARHNQESQRLSLKQSDCWRCVTASSGNSTSSSPLSSFSAWSPLSAGSNFPPLPMHHHTHSPTPRAAFPSAAKPEQLAPAGQRQDATDEHADEDMHQFCSRFPGLRQRFQSAFSHILHRKGICVLLTSRGQQQKTHYLFLPPSQRRATTLEVPRQAQSQGSVLPSGHPQWYCQLLQSDAHLGHRHTNVFHQLQRQQRHLRFSTALTHQQKIYGWPKQKQLQYQERKHLRQQPSKIMTKISQHAFPCMDGGVTEQHKSLLLIAIRKLLGTLRGLWLFLFHVIGLAKAFTTKTNTLHAIESREPANRCSSGTTSSKTYRTDASSGNSSASCIRNITASNEDCMCGTGCCLTSHSSRWTNDSERCIDLPRAILRWRVLLLKLYRLTARRQAEHNAISTVAGPSSKTSRSASDCSDAAAVPHVLLAEANFEADQGSTSSNDSSRKAPSSRGKRRAGPSWKEDFGLASASPSTAAQAIPGVTMFAAASNKAFCAVKTETFYAGRRLGRALAGGAVRQANKEKSTEADGSTPSLRATIVDIADSSVFSTAEVFLARALHNMIFNRVEGADSHESRHAGVSAETTSTGTAPAAALLKAAPSNEVRAFAGEASSCAGGTVSLIVAPTSALKKTVKACNAFRGGEDNSILATLPGCSRSLMCMSATRNFTSTQADDQEIFPCMNDIACSPPSVACEIWTCFNFQSRGIATARTLQGICSPRSADANNATTTAAILVASLSTPDVTVETALRSASVTTNAGKDSSVPPPASLIVVEESGRKATILSEQPERRPINSDTNVGASRATFDTTSRPSKDCAVDDAGAQSAGPHATLKSGAGINTTQGCRPRTATPPRRLRQVCVSNNERLVRAGTATVDDAAAATNARQQVEIDSGLSDSSCLRHPFGMMSSSCSSTRRIPWSRPGNSGGNCCAWKRKKQKVHVGSREFFFGSGCSSSENDEENFFCSTATSLEDVSEEEEGGVNVQQVFATDAQTTIGTSTGAAKTGKAAFHIDTNAAAGKHGGIPGLKTAAVSRSTVTRGVERSTCKDAEAKGEQALLRRRQREMLNRSLLLLRGTWMMCLVQSRDSRSSCKARGSKIHNRRLSSSNSSSSISRGCITRERAGTFESVGTSERTAVEIANGGNLSEDVQLLRRYLFVSPDFQYICCTDIPPPSAAAVDYEEIASPPPPTCQQPRQQAECSQTQQRQSQAEQPTQQHPFLLGRSVDPQQQPPDKQHHRKQQQYQKKLVPGECQLQQAHTDEMSQQQQAMQACLPPQRAAELYQRLEKSGPFCWESRGASEQKELERQHFSWNEQPQHPLQSTQQYSANLVSKEKRGKQQAALAEEGGEAQQDPIKEPGERQHQVHGAASFLADPPEAYAIEPMLFKVSAFTTDERQQSSARQHSNITTATAELHDHKEIKSALQLTGCCLSSPWSAELCRNWKGIWGIEKMPHADTRSSNSNCGSAADKRICGITACPMGLQNSEDHQSSNNCQSSCSAGNGNESSTRGHQINTYGAKSHGNSFCNTAKSVRENHCTIQQSSKLEELQSVKHDAVCLPLNSNSEGITAISAVLPTRRKSGKYSGTSSSLVLGYGSLNSNTDLSTCTSDCAAKIHAHKRKKLLLPPKPVLPPASCVWFCANNDSSNVQLSGVTGGADTHNSRSNLKHNISSLEQHTQQFRSFQNMSETESLRQQQKHRHACQKSVEHVARPSSSSSSSSSCGQQQLGLAQDLNRNHEQTDGRHASHEDNGLLLRQPSSGKSRPATSSSSNCKRIMECPWRDLFGTSALQQAETSSCVKPKIADAVACSNLDVEVRSCDEPDVFTISGDSPCSQNIRGTRSASKTASEPTACATHTLVEEGQGSSGYTQLFAAEPQKEPKETGEGQTARAKLATPEGLATAVAGNTGESAQKPLRRSQPLAETLKGSGFVKYGSHCSADFGGSGNLSTSGAGKSPPMSEKNGASLDSAELSVKIQSGKAKECTTHTLSTATVWSCHMGSGDICSETTIVTKSPPCTNAAASPPACERPKTSDGLLVTSVLPGATRKAMGTLDSTNVVSSGEPEGKTVHRVVRRACHSHRFPARIPCQSAIQQKKQRHWCASAHGEDSEATVEEDQKFSTVYIPLKRVCSLAYGYGSSTYQRLQRSRCSALQSIPPYLCCSVRVLVPEHVAEEHLVLTVVQQSELPHQQTEETQPRQTPKAIQMDVDFVTLTAADAARWVIGLNGLIPYSPGRVLYTQEEVAKQLCLMRQQQKQRWQLERSLRRWRRATVATAHMQLSKALLQSPLLGLTILRSLLRSCLSGRPFSGSQSGRRARRKCRVRYVAFRISNCTGVSSRTGRSRNRNSRALGLGALNAQCPYTRCRNIKTQQHIIRSSSSRARFRKAKARRNSSTSQVSSSRCRRRNPSDAPVRIRRTTEEVSASNRGPKEYIREEGGRHCCARRDIPHSQVPTPPLSSNSNSHTGLPSARTGSDFDLSESRAHRGTSCSRISIATRTEECGRDGSLQARSPSGGRRSTYSDCFRSCVQDIEPRVADFSDREERQQLTHTSLRCRSSPAVAFQKGKIYAAVNPCRHCCCNCSSFSQVSFPLVAAPGRTDANQSNCRSRDCGAYIRCLHGAPYFPGATKRSYSAPPTLARENKESQEYYHSVITPKHIAAPNGRVADATLTPAALPVCALSKHCFAFDSFMASGAGDPYAAARSPTCSAVEAAAAMEEGFYEQTKRRRPLFHRLFRFATARWNVKLRRRSGSVPSKTFRRRNSCSPRHSAEKKSGDGGTGGNYISSRFDSSGGCWTAGSTTLQRSKNAADYNCRRPTAVKVQHCCRCSVLAASPLAQESNYSSPCSEDWSFWPRPWDGSPAAAQQEDGSLCEIPLMGAATSEEKGQPSLQESFSINEEPAQQHKQGQERLEGILQQEPVECGTKQQRQSPLQPQCQRAGPTRQQLVLYALQKRHHQQVDPAQQRSNPLMATCKSAHYKDIISSGLLRHLHSIGSTSTRCSSTSSLGSSGLQLHHDVSTFEGFPQATEAGRAGCIHKCCYAENKEQQQLHRQQNAGQQENDADQQNHSIPKHQQEEQNRQEQQLVHSQSWQEFGSCRYTVGLLQPQHRCCAQTCPRCGTPSQKDSFSGSIACHRAFFYRRCASCSSISRVSTPCSTTIGTPSTMSFSTSPGGRSTSSTDYSTSTVENRCSWKECTCFNGIDSNTFPHQRISSQQANCSSPSSTLGGTVHSITALAWTAGGSPAHISGICTCSSLPTAAPDAVVPDAKTEAERCICAASVKKADGCGGTELKRPSEQVDCHLPDKQPHQICRQQRSQDARGNFNEMSFHHQERQQLSLSSRLNRKVEPQNQLKSNQGSCSQLHEELEGITPIAEEDSLSYMHQQEEYKRGGLDMMSGEEVTRFYRSSNEDNLDSDEESVLFSAY